jgi:hypothetical protein
MVTLGLVPFFHPFGNRTTLNSFPSENLRNAGEWDSPPRLRKEQKMSEPPGKKTRVGV